ncbi:cell filamentation protein fic [Klebsiella michiganensis]|nr:cell filamentation protein fic [Klebsiella michiganensis]
MSDKFGEGRDPYLYPGLKVMRNRLGIRQAQRLEQAAWELTALRAATIELGPLVRGLPHLCAIHRQLYQDVFDWAGQLREVDIYQGDTRFCHFAYIEKEGNALLQDLEEEGYLVGLAQDNSLNVLLITTAKLTSCILSVSVTAWRNAFSLSSWLFMRAIRWIGAILRSMRGTRPTRAERWATFLHCGRYFAKW